MVRGILKAKSLPNTFWTKDVTTSIYLFYICGTRCVQNMTLYQAWSGTKHSVVI